jgi:ketol-acid reductoisomerase
MNTKPTQLYHLEDGDLKWLDGLTVAVIGYGNQGRAQALNLRDSGIQVIVGNQRDDYRERIIEDGFDVFEISQAVVAAHIILLLVPDEVIPTLFEVHIRPNLKPGCAVVFASGYCLAFDQVQMPLDVDVLLLAPRMIGVGVRERYLTGEGFFCLVGVDQDASGISKERLLALTLAIGGLDKPAIEVTFKQETILDLFNEQAFGPAFGRVLLTAIDILVENGLPPEAALVEMYLSEEMAYTYRKMAQSGLVRQTLYHSQTSQYGAMSRGVRFLGLGLRERMGKIYDEIDSGAFASEWQSPFARLKFEVIRFFAMRQAINKLEMRVRRALGLEDIDPYEVPGKMRAILQDPKIQAELEGYERSFEF